MGSFGGPRAKRTHSRSNKTHPACGAPMIQWTDEPVGSRSPPEEAGSPLPVGPPSPEPPHKVGDEAARHGDGPDGD
jgi:hypothetical protein